MPRQVARAHWGSRLGFILAAAGSAVGLGNIWKFPFIAGESGGAAFVLIYLVCILLIGVPVLLIEFALGRRSERNPVGAYASVAGPTRFWPLAGGMGVLCGFIILSYYSVVAGWCMGYVVKAVANQFSTFGTADDAALAFGTFAGNPVVAIFYHALFMVLCIVVVAQGVRGGIERWSRILMPTLVLILIALVARGVSLPGAEAGLRFLFAPDFSKISPDVVLVALGHAFFTLSIGMGAMITYGSYLNRDDDLVASGIVVAFLDTAIALIAGVAIFSAVFAYGFDPAAGPGLIFHVLPVVFGQMPGGVFFASLFFVLLSIAALTSGISLLEVVTSYMVDEKGWSRPRAAWTLGLAILALGIPSALSAGPMADFRIGPYNWFDFFDYLSFKYLLPLGGLLSITFVLGRWGVESLLAELGEGSKMRLPSPALSGWWLVLSAILVVMTFVAGVMGKI